MQNGRGHVLLAAGKDAAVHPDNMQHAGDDTLELYSLHKLEQADLDALEEHLLVCPSCQDRAMASDAYVKAVRAAAAKLRREEAGAAAGWSRRFWWKPLAAAAGVAAVAIGAYWMRPASFRTSPAPVAVVLQSLRGEPFLVKAPQRTPLELELDLTGLPDQLAWEVELVNSAGNLVHREAARPAGHKLKFEYRPGLESGTYWIRLYRPGAPRRLAREFGLTAEIR